MALIDFKFTRKEVCWHVHAGIGRGLLTVLLKNISAVFVLLLMISRLVRTFYCQQKFWSGYGCGSLFSQFPSALESHYSIKKKRLLLGLACSSTLKLDTFGAFPHCYYSKIFVLYTCLLIIFSHRRATHQGLSTCGRMTNLILIKDLHGLNKN